MVEDTWARRDSSEGPDSHAMKAVQHVPVVVGVKQAFGCTSGR